MKLPTGACAQPPAEFATLAPIQIPVVDPMTALKYLQAYPPALQEQVRQLIAKDQLGDYLTQRYPNGMACRATKRCTATPRP